MSSIKFKNHFFTGELITNDVSRVLEVLKEKDKVKEVNTISLYELIVDIRI